MVSLLPPNTTPLERALSETLSDYQDVWAALQDITYIEISRNPIFSPWLAAQLRLAEFAPYFPDAAALIDAGLPWLRVRGTVAAVRIALSWIGLQQCAIEDDAAYLHIDPGRIIALSELASIIQLVKASVPAHVHFYRMYHGYDLRHFVLDRSRLDDGILDDDSGVLIDGIKMSFARHHGGFIPADDDNDFYHAHQRTTSCLSWDDDSWRLDSWRLDSTLLIDCAGALISMRGHIIDWQDDTLAAAVRTRMFGGFVPAEDLPVYHRHTANHSAHLIRMRRGWTGRWVGPWRDPVYVHHFQETH